nr:NB-ARC domain-containing protein [Xenococcus sp. PCC 7305]
MRLSQQLQEKNQVTIAHIEGMGGIGKTELAIVYSLTNLQCNTYPGGICWLFCRDQDIGLQIVNFARNYLGLTPPEDLELLEQVTWCWQRWNKGNTLIVLDDVTDYEKIESYLPPQSSQFKVLVTTRLKLELANSLYLQVLSESESLELLSELIGSEKVNLELATAKELCQQFFV